MKGGPISTGSLRRAVRVGPNLSQVESGHNQPCQADSGSAGHSGPLVQVPRNNSEAAGSQRGKGGGGVCFLVDSWRALCCQILVKVSTLNKHLANHCGEVRRSSILNSFSVIGGKKMCYKS